ncbi:hypothetical protein [Sphingomonas sp. GB1N7]|uniref:hypothetical protein n=1 Tax=Parasphingomonas caseinilytica TaxID=3096158 RepID=UPI002FC7FB4F
MLIAIAITAATIASEAKHPAMPFDFSQSYAVWAGSNQGRCYYSITDVLENAKQLTQTLRENYDLNGSIEILTSDGTPTRCAIKGVRAARKAGFRHVRSRVGTEGDRSSALRLP